MNKPCVFWLVLARIINNSNLFVCLYTQRDQWKLKQLSGDKLFPTYKTFTCEVNFGRGYNLRKVTKLRKFLCKHNIFYIQYIKLNFLTETSKSLISRLTAGSIGDRRAIHRRPCAFGGGRKNGAPLFSLIPSSTWGTCPCLYLWGWLRIQPVALIPRNTRKLPLRPWVRRGPELEGHSSLGCNWKNWGLNPGKIIVGEERNHTWSIRAIAC